jgi:hypothetical protein
MPLDSYTWIHKDAILTAQEISALVSWTETAREELKNQP